MPKSLEDIRKVYNARNEQSQWNDIHNNLRTVQNVLAAVSLNANAFGRTQLESEAEGAYSCFLDLDKEPNSGDNGEKIEAALSKLPQVVKFLKDPDKQKELTDFLKYQARELGEDPDKYVGEFNTALDSLISFYTPELVIQQQEIKEPEKKEEVPVPEDKKEEEPKAGPEKDDKGIAVGENVPAQEEPKEPEKTPREKFDILRRALDELEPEDFAEDRDRIRLLSSIAGMQLLHNTYGNDTYKNKSFHVGLDCPLNNGKTRRVQVTGDDEALQAIYTNLQPVLDVKVGDSTVREKIFANAKTDKEKADLNAALAFVLATGNEYGKKQQEEAEKKREAEKRAKNELYENIIKAHTGEVRISTADKDFATSLAAYNWDQKGMPYNKRSFESDVNTLQRQAAFKAYIKNPDFRNHFVRNGDMKTAMNTLTEFTQKYPLDERGTLKYSWENYIWKHTGPNANYADYKGDLAKVICAKRMQAKGEPFSIDAVRAAAKELQKSPSFKRLSKGDAASCLFTSDTKTAERILAVHKKNIENENRNIAVNGPNKGDKKSFGGYIYMHSHQAPEGKSREYLAKIVAASRLMEQDVPFNIKTVRREAENVMNDPNFKKAVGSEDKAAQILASDNGQSIVKKLNMKQPEAENVQKIEI